MDVSDDAGAVVGGAPAEQALPAALGGEGVGLRPGGRIADGLDVVVSVEEHARRPDGTVAVGQDGGPTGDAVGPDEAEHLRAQTGAGQEAGDVLGAAEHLDLVVTGSGYRRDGDELDQVGDDRLEGVMDGGAHGVDGDHGLQGIASEPLLCAA